MAYLGNTPGVSSQRIVTDFIATASQTTFSPSGGYQLGYLDVYLNGVRLIDGTDFTAADGSSFVLTTGAGLNDEVTAVAYVARGLSDGYTKAEADSNFLASSDIGTSVQAYDATIVVDADIGVTVQGYDADTLKADTADTLTASFRGSVTTDNDLSFDMNATNNFSCTPTANGTLTFTNITAGQSGNIYLVNGSNYAISAASTTYISAADLSAISASGTYYLSYYSPDGTNVMVSASAAVTSAGA